MLSIFFIRLWNGIWRVSECGVLRRLRQRVLPAVRGARRGATALHGDSPGAHGTLPTHKSTVVKNTSQLLKLKVIVIAIIINVDSFCAKELFRISSECQSVKYRLV